MSSRGKVLAGAVVVGVIMVLILFSPGLENPPVVGFYVDTQNSSEPCLFRFYAALPEHPVSPRPTPIRITVPVGFLVSASDEKGLVSVQEGSGQVLRIKEALLREKACYSGLTLDNLFAKENAFAALQSPRPTVVCPGCSK